MKLNTIPFKKTLNKAYQKVKPNRSDINRFKANLQRLLQRIDHEESEENVKNHLRDFLNDTYYNNLHLLNTKGRTDLVIHNESSRQSQAAVLFEVKRPKNNADMIGPANANAKAMQEMALYYLRERIEANNTDIKYLVITNIYEWYIFDAAAFDRLFFQNKTLVRDYEDWKNGRKIQSTTDFFYKDIARPFLDQIQGELSAAYFNIKDYEVALLNDDEKDDKRLIPLYKVFSPQHLLKLPFANDSNSLDKGFYNELLYLIGLEEEKEGGKKIIRRCAPERRQPGSMLENALNIIAYEDRMRHVHKGDAFDVALELCITWVNRILFLKLLESQLVKYHQGEPGYRFLTSKLIHDYDGLNKLFFQVLAEKPDRRSEAVRAVFGKVPYLNSSLFEITEKESAAIRINSLEDELTMPLHPRTVLKDDKGKPRTGRLDTLQYLFAFLDAYDFSSEGSEEIQEENKTLINASVLGLIFEKINGYRDGSFFTPGFVTMYMSRETVRRAVVQKFNAAYSFGCEDLGDLANHLAQRRNKTDILEHNKIVNSLRICDPAVGSGHFLVSALNELIAVKSELGILADREGVVLRGYEARVENDELITTCNDGQDLFEYRLRNGAADRDTQRVQETLFHEKQAIIENCLFGVDINPNSVKICRLRLWIELLKNTYYLGGTASGGLETLPNIDINIKTGNSLISRFALDADLKQALKKSNLGIEVYRIAVHQYHRATGKDEKRELERLLNQIKTNFKTEIGRNDPLRKQLEKLESLRLHKFTGNFLFEPEETYGDQAEELSKKSAAEHKKLDTQIEAIKLKMADIENNKIYLNAFEWRFEFPGALDDEGNFVGFDVVIGNPPYIRQEEFSELKPYLQSNYQTYAGTADLLVYFIELGMNLLRPGGVFNFIISNKFMRANFGKPLREWLGQYRILEILDFGDLPVFEEATTYPCTLQLHKSAPADGFFAANIAELDTADFGNYVQSLRFFSSQSALSAEGWNLSDTAVQQLLEKLKKTGIPLGEYVKGKIYYGIKTGLNEAFVIDEATKNRLIAEDSKSAEVIKPFLAGRDVKRYVPPRSDKFLILFQKGWTIAAFGKLPEEEAFQKLEKSYPAIAGHFLPFAEKGRKRADQGDYWWELRACDYYEEFEKPKILYQEIATFQSFTYDEKSLYCNNKIFFIPAGSFSLLGFLNSKLVWFYLDKIASKLQGGAFAMQSPYVLSIPFLETIIDNENIASLVTQILSQKRQNPQADTSGLERQIDEIVYGLYGLTEEEIAIIDV